MTRSARFLSVLLLSACSQPGSSYAANEASHEEVNGALGSAKPRSPAPSATPKTDQRDVDHANLVRTLRRRLVGVATLDGAAISDVRTIDACHTAFATMKGDVNIDWTKGGNIAPRDIGGHEVNDLPGPDRDHPLSMPVGRDANGVSGAVGLFVSECAAGF